MKGLVAALALWALAGTGGAQQINDLAVGIGTGEDRVVVTDANDDDGGATNGVIELRNRAFPPNPAQAKIVSLDVAPRRMNGYDGIVLTTPSGVTFESQVAAPMVVSLDVSGTLVLGAAYKGADGSLSGSAKGGGNLVRLWWDAKADNQNIRANGTFARVENLALPDPPKEAAFNKKITDPGLAGGGPNVALRGIMDVHFGANAQAITLPSSAFVGVAAVGEREEQKRGGKKLKMKDSPTGADVVVYLSKDAGLTPPSADGTDDPTITGATFTIVNPATAEATTYDLPAADGGTLLWTRNTAGTVFKYKNPLAPDDGPSQVKIVVLKAGLLKVVAKGLGEYALDESSQGMIATVLTTGTTDYCSRFDTPKRDEGIAGTSAGLYLAKDQPPPALCGSPSAAFLEPR